MTRRGGVPRDPPSDPPSDPATALLTNPVPVRNSDNFERFPDAISDTFPDTYSDTPASDPKSIMACLLAMNHKRWREAIYIGIGIA